MLKSPLLCAAPLLLAGGLFAQPGALIGQFNSPAGESPISLGVSPTGDLYMSTLSRMIYRLSQSGTVLSSFDASNDTGICGGITTDGTNIFIVDSSTTSGGRGVDVYDMQGNYVRTFPVSSLLPAGICFVPGSNHLFLVDRPAAQVIEYDLQGNQIASFSLGGASDGIGYDPATTSFWVYEVANDLVVNYDSQFNSLTNFPGPGTAIGNNGRGLTYVGGICYVVVQPLRLVALFDTTGTAAAVEVYGNGCPNPGLFYEEFTDSGGSNPSDVTGLAFRFNAQGNSWVASRSGSFETTIGNGLNMADDQIDRAVPLGFTFNLPGARVGSTTAIDISSNGWVGLEPNVIPDTGYYVGATARTNEFPSWPRIAAWWTDLDPSVNAGDVHFITKSNPTRAVITWNQVSRFGANPPDVNTIQLKLYATGDWEIVYQTGCLENAYTGYSPGGSPPDPGSIDLTASIPGVFGPYGVPLGLDGTRPIVGTNVTYTVSPIPMGSALAALIFGSAQTSTPLDPINMPGCTLLSSGDLATAPVNVATGLFTFGIPNQTGLIGANVYHQAFVVVAGFNPFGVIASNGLKYRIGN